MKTLEQINLEIFLCHLVQTDAKNKLGNSIRKVIVLVKERLAQIKQQGAI